MLKAIFAYLGTLMLVAAWPCHGQFVITEFMANNTRTLTDEDGTYQDWIEIQNVSSNTVSLLNWHLTDSAGDRTKWTFPATNVGPGQFVVVFASGKDRRTPGARLHTNFKLDATEGEYLALVDPNGDVATEFAPVFPPQIADVSYGFDAGADERCAAAG